MKRLELSGAVRPIYGSLGVKRLINKFCVCVFILAATFVLAYNMVSTPKLLYPTAWNFSDSIVWKVCEMSQFKYLLTGMAGDKMFQFYSERLSLDEFQDENFCARASTKVFIANIKASFTLSTLSNKWQRIMAGRSPSFVLRRCVLFSKSDLLNKCVCLVEEETRRKLRQYSCIVTRTWGRILKKKKLLNSQKFWHNTVLVSDCSKSNLSLYSRMHQDLTLLRKIFLSLTSGTSVFESLI